MKNNLRTKLDATEAIVKLIANWKDAKSVIIFQDAHSRVKATKRKNDDSILLTFGRLNYNEKLLRKKFVPKGKTSFPLIIPEKKSKK